MRHFTGGFALGSLVWLLANAEKLGAEIQQRDWARVAGSVIGCTIVASLFGTIVWGLWP